MDEEELVCRPDLLACTPDAEHDSGEHMHHAVHAAELAHDLEHATHAAHAVPMSSPRAAPGSGGHHDPDYWAEVGRRAVREESLLAPVGVPSESMSEESRVMLEDMSEGPMRDPSPTRRSIDEHMDDVMVRYEAERLASTSTTGDPMHVPARGEEVVWPPHYGARDGVVHVESSRVGETYTRRGGPGGEFFAVGDPPIGARSLRPTYDPWGDVAPDYIGTDTEYTVAREFPVERSEAAPWFAREGGATQVRAPLVAGTLEAGGYLSFEHSRSLAYANDAEISEIRSAVLECGDADDLAALGEMDSSLLTIPRDPVAPPPAAPPSMMSRLFGGLGVLGGIRDMRHGVSEIMDGEYTAGLADLASGGLGAFTGGLTVAGEAASIAPPVALAAGLAGAVSAGEHYNQEHGTFGTDGEGHGLSSVEFALDWGQGAYDWVHDGVAGGDEGGVRDYLGWGLGSFAGVGGTALGGLIGLGGDLYHGVPALVGGAYDLVLGAGEEYNAEHDVWGAPTTDEEGHVHHMTSMDFARAEGGDAYDGIHDAIATNVDGVGGEILGTIAGGVGGAVVGAGAGVIGVGGDLLRTAERIVTSGDRYMGERGVWGESAVGEDDEEHPRSSIDMIVDDTRATYADWHDSAAEAGLGETGSAIVGNVAGSAMAVGDSVLALGGNIVGLAGAGIDLAGSAASAAWSWMTD